MRYKPSLERRDHGWNATKPSPAGEAMPIFVLTPPDEPTAALALGTCWKHARGAGLAELLDDLDFIQGALGLDVAP